jgi:hypothetical protein
MASVATAPRNAVSGDAWNRSNMYDYLTSQEFGRGQIKEFNSSE